MAIPPHARRSHRVGRWLIGSAVGLALALVAARAGLAAWYRHDYKRLADAGRLPSQWVTKVSNIIGRVGGPCYPGGRFDVSEVPLTEPSPPDAAGWSPWRVKAIMGGRQFTAGDLDRLGWDIYVGVNQQGQATGSGARYRDELAVRPAGVWARRVIDATAIAVPVLAIAVMLGTLAALAGWRRGWRRTFAVPTAAGAIVLATAVVLGQRVDRTFVTGTVADPFRWWPGGLLVPAAVLAAWPSRHRFGPGHCDRCGYDLTGNVSGTCPECGSAAGGDGPGRPPVPTTATAGEG